MNRIKTLQELNLLDRFLFSEVMADNEILEDVLEIILDRPVPLKDKAQAEKELRRTPQNKSVYFDVYGEDIRDYKCQDKYAQKFSYKYVQFILLSILSRFLGKGAEADKIFLLL